MTDINKIPKSKEQEDLQACIKEVQEVLEKYQFDILPRYVFEGNVMTAGLTFQKKEKPSSIITPK